MNAAHTLDVVKPEHTPAPEEVVYVKVSSKGQIVIPAGIRHELGIEAGTRLAMRVEDGRVVVDIDNVESRLRKLRALRGLTAGGPSMTDELLEERRQDLEIERAEGW